MTARHSPLFTLESRYSGLRIYASLRGAALVFTFSKGHRGDYLLPEDEDGAFFQARETKRAYSAGIG